jgi:hypothetical protein
MAESPLIKGLDELIVHVKRGALDAGYLERNLAELKRLASQTAEALQRTTAENQTLTVFYTLQGRLFENLVPKGVAEAVSEIAVNFLGTEDFALYVRQGDHFVPLAGMGKTFKSAKPFAPGEGTRGALVSKGDASFATGGMVVQACLLNPTGKTVGFIEVGSLLTHKPRLTFEDRELLSMVKTKAGAALALALERHHG